MTVPHLRVEDVVEHMGDETRRWSRTSQLVVVLLVLVTAALDLAVDSTHAQALLWVPLVAVSAIVWHPLEAAGMVVLAIVSGVASMAADSPVRTVLLEAAGRAVVLSVVAAGTVWLSRAARELARRSRVDAATGLLNGAGFRAVLERERERSLRSDRPLSVVYLDLDGLKQTNDRLGHAAGDELLVRFADHLHRESRTVDVAARLGGDEFALLLPDTDALGAAEVLERFFGSLAGDERCLPVSAGAVTWAVPPPPSEMLAVADKAMYEVKRRGGRDWMVVDVDRWVTTQGTSNRADRFQPR